MTASRMPGYEQMAHVPGTGNHPSGWIGAAISTSFLSWRVWRHSWLELPWRVFCWK